MIHSCRNRDKALTNIGWLPIKDFLNQVYIKNYLFSLDLVSSIFFGYLDISN